METLFCALKLKLWDVEISNVSCVIAGNLLPLTILVPVSFGALLIDLFVCHDRSIKIDDLINVPPVIAPGVF